MDKKTFGNAILGEKMATRFGEKHKVVAAELEHSQEVEDFVREINLAHARALESELVFG